MKQLLQDKNTANLVTIRNYLEFTACIIFNMNFDWKHSKLKTESNLFVEKAILVQNAYIICG